MADGLRAATSAYAVLVLPIFNPHRKHPLADRVLVIDVPESVQLERTMARDGNTREQVEAIMSTQTGRVERLAAADEIITNDGSVAALHAKVDQQHAEYLALVEEHANAKE